MFSARFIVLTKKVDSAVCKPSRANLTVPAILEIKVITSSQTASYLGKVDI